MTLKIAIVGYGKMGHAVEALAGKHNVEIASIIDPSEKGATYNSITKESLSDVDIAIDFTSSTSALKNIDIISSLNKNIIIGTTGWYSNIQKVKEIVNNRNIGLVYSPNFSIGVNLFFQIVKNTAILFDKFPSYDPFIYEMHHNQKTDSPGGTAKKLGEIIITNVRRKKNLVYDKIDGRHIAPDELHVASIRAGYLPGTHVVGFDGEADTIELRHTARSRLGFAEGALFAAKWINGKKGFYSLEDIITEITR